MKKLAIFGLAMMLVFGMSVVSMAAFDIDTGDSASPSVDLGVDLKIEKSASISAPNNIDVVIPGGEGGGEGRAEYTVFSNFPYQVTASIADNSDNPLEWEVSADGGTVSTDTGQFTSGQQTTVTNMSPDSLAGTPHELVVAVDPYDNVAKEFYNYSEAGTYDAATVTLTVSAASL